MEIEPSRLISREKVKPAGLRRFYFQMANPSVDFLESACRRLIALPFADLLKLQSANNEPIGNPNLGYPEALVEGRANVTELVHEIATLRCHYADSPAGSTVFNPHAFAERIYNHIQKRRYEGKINQLVERIKKEPDLLKRYHLGLTLKRQIENYSEKFPFDLAFELSSKEMKDVTEHTVPTWDNLVEHYVRLNDGFGSSVKEPTIVATAAISRYHLEPKLAKLPVKDQERFSKLRFRYGAKGANLILLKEFIDRAKRQLKNYLGMVSVPDFRTVSIDLYRAWSEGRL